MKSDKGRRFEGAARRYLEKRGLKTLARNFACRSGEVDLIMLDREELTFVEVRYRSRADFGGAAASVTATKQRRIIRAAKAFLRTHPHQAARPCRFDVVAIDGALFPRIEWIQHAFTQ